MGFEIVCCLALNDSVARHHLVPLAEHPLVSRLWIVRHRTLAMDDIPNAEYILLPTKYRLWRFLQMLYICLILGRKEKVRAFVSFNPFPYGLFSYLAARLNRKAIHFGFIGSDWNRWGSSWLGRCLLPLLRSGDFVTVMGRSMRQEMLQRGFRSSRLAILPQSTDLDRFPVADPRDARYTCIFLGSLIELKNVDVILRAFHELRATHPEARLGILGDGSLRPELERLAQRLGIDDRVEFVGFVQNVQPYLSASRIIVIASRCEGFPSSLVEGICCGLVPVCTRVGAIPDVIAHGRNGFFFPTGDSAALADCVRKLLDDPELYKTLRTEVLKLRETFAHESTTHAWDGWLNTLVN